MSRTRERRKGRVTFFWIHSSKKKKKFAGQLVNPRWGIDVEEPLPELPEL